SAVAMEFRSRGATRSRSAPPICVTDVTSERSVPRGMSVQGERINREIPAVGQADFLPSPDFGSLFQSISGLMEQDRPGSAPLMERFRRLMLPFFLGGGSSDVAAKSGIEKQDQHRLKRKDRKRKRALSSAVPSASLKVRYSQCLHCGKRHEGVCLKAAGKCYHCAEVGHLRREGPKLRLHVAVGRRAERR